MEALDRDITWARALDGTEYMPGLVGLNNMKANDYANVVVQILARVSPIRDFFLIPSNYADCQSLLVQRTGDLLRKIWNPKAFKGQVRSCPLILDIPVARSVYPLPPACKSVRHQHRHQISRNSPRKKGCKARGLPTWQVGDEG